jgi:uncharacterized protein YabN with tetrapyrrole methylase and pyrophosphatase domain
MREIRNELRAPVVIGETPALRSRLEEEVGDLLFSVANLARFVRSDPETCLRKANQKFIRRFQALEREVSAQGKKLRECSLEEMESLWNELKSKE